MWIDKIWKRKVKFPFPCLQPFVEPYMYSFSVTYFDLKNTHRYRSVKVTFRGHIILLFGTGQSSLLPSKQGNRGLVTSHSKGSSFLGLLSISNSPLEQCALVMLSAVLSAKISHFSPKLKIWRHNSTQLQKNDTKKYVSRQTPRTPLLWMFLEIPGSNHKARNPPADQNPRLLSTQPNPHLGILGICEKKSFNSTTSTSCPKPSHSCLLMT